MNGFDNVHEKRNRSLTYIGDLRASVLYAGLRFQALGVSANKRKELLGIAEHLNRWSLDASRTGICSIWRDCQHPCRLLRILGINDIGSKE